MRTLVAVSAFILGCGGCASTAPRPPLEKAAVEAAAEELYRETSDDTEAALSEAYRSRERCEALVDLIVDTFGEGSKEMISARLAYIDASAAGNSAIEEYKRSLDATLFAPSAPPKLVKKKPNDAAEAPESNKIIDSVDLMLVAEGKLREIATSSKANNSIQTIDAVLHALNGLYDLIWKALRNKRAEEAAVKEGYLTRVEERVDGYKWKSWDLLRTKPIKTG